MRTFASRIIKLASNWEQIGLGFDFPLICSNYCLLRFSMCTAVCCAAGCRQAVDAVPESIARLAQRTKNLTAQATLACAAVYLCCESHCLGALLNETVALLLSVCLTVSFILILRLFLDSGNSIRS